MRSARREDASLEAVWPKRRHGAQKNGDRCDGLQEWSTPTCPGHHGAGLRSPISLANLRIDDALFLAWKGRRLYCIWTAHHLSV
jgi:hypothetical protein